MIANKYVNNSTDCHDVTGQQQKLLAQCDDSWTLRIATVARTSAS